MNKQLAEKWVEALRSGEYNQGTSALRSGYNQFCCLGVLCDVIDPSGWIPSLDSRRPYTYNGIMQVLPPSILEISGMRHDLGDYHNEKPHLALMNDHGYSFAEIADTIEQNWETL